MKTYYLIATQDMANHRLVYHTAKEYYKGGELLGDIFEARKFESMEEIGKWLIEDPWHYGYCLGFTVVSVADVTLDKMKKDIEQGDYELYRRFHNPLYVH